MVGGAPSTRKRRGSARSSADGLPVGSILIVEDDQVVVELVRLFLGAIFAVRQATTSNEALRVLGSERIDLVVLDHRLPDGTGLEVLTSIRAAHFKLPVIMITGYGSEELCRAAFKLGVADYLAKPFNMFELKNAVSCALARESAGVPTPVPAPTVEGKPA